MTTYEMVRCRHCCYLVEDNRGRWCCECCEYEDEIKDIHEISNDDCPLECDY